VTAPALLHSVHHPGQVTATDALAWFSASASGTSAIGYSFGPDRAEWFRCAGPPAPYGPGGLRPLGEAFEVFATSGTCQLRWFHQTMGQGWAVCLGEDPAALPPGDAAPVQEGSLERRRLPGTVRRLLAGRATAVGDGWARLVTARYPPCDVPVVAADGQDVWALLAEYAVTDEHGNVSVADTLLLSLTAQDHVPTARERQR
jgi:hypothetical protein